MTSAFSKLSIIGIALALLVGCSFNGLKSVAGRWSTLPSEERAEVVSTMTSEACLTETASPFHLRKAVLVAGTIGVPVLAKDLPGLADLTSRRLQTHLDALQRFNVLATHGSSFESMAVSTAEHVRLLGHNYSSQFVVKIEIDDLTAHYSGVWIPKPFRRSNRRNVLIKLYVFDTENGAVFDSQQYHRTVRGNVMGYPGNGTSVTAAWFKTDLGKEIDKILKTMSVQINEKLACVPFSSRVTAVKGSDIHINAGYLHGIRPQETLRVYRSRDFTIAGGAPKQEENEVWIKVDTVYPEHSIASTNSDNLIDKRLDAGDVVRAW